MLFQKDLDQVENIINKNSQSVGDDRRKLLAKSQQEAKRAKIIANMELLNKIVPDVTIEELQQRTQAEKERIQKARIIRQLADKKANTKAAKSKKNAQIQRECSLFLKKSWKTRIWRKIQNALPKTR